MSRQILSREYAFVQDSCVPRETRAVRLELLDDGTLVIGDWSEECDLFDSGSEIRFTPSNAAVLSRVLAANAALVSPSVRVSAAEAPDTTEETTC